MSYLAQSSTSDRDPAPHTSALAYFRNVIDRFPTSPWAERSQLRLRECRESLAKHDAGIALYERALDAFVGGDWSQAFTILHEVPPWDQGKDFLTSHILSHRREPPPGWDGVVALESK